MKHTSIDDSAYYEQQAEIMREMQSILNRRTATNGAQIAAALEALQRRAYPEVYRDEPQQISKAQDVQTRQAQPETVQGVTFMQGCAGLAYLLIIKPIKSLKARK